MAFGKFLKSIFAGNSQASKIPAVLLEYKEFIIEAAPVSEGGKYRIAGFISGSLDGEIKRIPFMRADDIADKDQAIEFSTSKARQIIDEQGVKLLEKTYL